MKDKFRTLDDKAMPGLPPPPPMLFPVEPKGVKMPVTFSLVLLVLALCCFLLAAFNTTPSARVNPLGLGLFLVTVAQLVRP
jgi:hypothetical protein